MVTTTDETGRFSMPGTFTGMITITASKDGYVPQTRPFPPPNRPLPPSEGVGRSEVFFHLGPHGPSANIAGVYTLTLTADSACTNLPDEARTRTYTATIVPTSGSTTSFLARLSDARIVFLPFSPYFEIGIAGDFANMSVRFVEQLGETTYRAIDGGAAASFGPAGITAPFNGYFLHCPTEPAWAGGEYWWCGAGTQGVECNSSNHQLTLVRR